MKEKNKKILTFVFNLFFSFVLLIFFINIIMFCKCLNVQLNLPYYEYQVMRIKIYGKSDNFQENTLSANISILDMQGNDCAVIERSWNANYLNVVFKTSEFNNQVFYFPEKIVSSDFSLRSTSYSNSFVSRSNGTNLYKYYLDNFQCFLIGSGSSYKQRNDLYNLAKFALSPLAYFTKRHSKKYTVDLSECVTNKYYGIFVDSNNNLILREQ